MRIVFFMQETGAVFGAERATLDLAHGLREAGHDPVFCLMEELRLEGRGGGVGAAVEDAGFPRHRFGVSGRLSRSLARQVRDRFRTVGGDVLHVIGYKANVHAWLSGIRPVVATVHGWLFRADLKERLYDATDRWCLRRCDRVICLSMHYETLLLRAGISRERLVRIPSGLRSVPALCPPLPGRERAGKDVTFGMLGRFSEEKNHRQFLDAAKQLLARGVSIRCLIAGQGPLREAVERRVAEQGLGRVVTVCGYMEVEAFMASIDAYVLCSRIENLPYSILEAMAHGRPVLGTRVGGIPDLVDDGETGLLVDLDDAAGLAEAMARLVAEPGVAVTMGQKGRTKLEAEFSLPRMVSAHEALYRQLSGREG